MKNEKIHSSLLGIVGGYLLYLAWQLFDTLRKGESTMAPGLQIAFIVLFVLAGAGILVYAWRDWEKQKKEEANGKTEKKQDDVYHL